jgi:hypothetical protein
LCSSLVGRRPLHRRLAAELMTARALHPMACPAVEALEGARRMVEGEPCDPMCAPCNTQRILKSLDELTSATRAIV